VTCVRQQCEADRSCTLVQQCRNMLSMCSIDPDHEQLQRIAVAVRQVLEDWDAGVPSKDLMLRLMDIQGDWPWTC